MKEQTVKKQTGKRKPKKSKGKFIDVDIWRAEFGPVSVKAILEIYRIKYNIAPRNLSKHPFSEIVNTLREAADPNYIRPVDLISE